MNNNDEAQFVSFDLKFIPCPPGTPASPRPADRPRPTAAELEAAGEPVFVSFECSAELLPPGTPASPRPADRPRPTAAELEAADRPRDDPDAAFARELAERVVEYVRGCPNGRSAEQVAALVQQFLARRSA